MSKLLLHYRTTLGPRTIIAEIADEATACAVRSAHQALGEESSLVDETPRLSMQGHITAHRKRQKKEKLRLASILPANVTPIKRRQT